MIIFILAFAFLVIFECLVYYLVLGTKFANSPPEEKYEGAKKGIERYFLQTISWITIVIGLMSLGKSDLRVLYFLFLSLIFFIFSFRIGWFSGTKRILFFIQQRLFNYSIIISYFGLTFLLFAMGLTSLGVFSILGLIFLFLLELYELSGDLRIGLGIKTNLNTKQK